MDTTTLPSDVAHLCGEYTSRPGGPAPGGVPQLINGAGVTITFVPNATLPGDLADDTGYGYSTTQQLLYRHADTFVFAGAALKLRAPSAGVMQLNATAAAGSTAVGAPGSYHSNPLAVGTDSSNWEAALDTTQFIYNYIAEVEQPECLSPSSPCLKRTMYTLMAMSLPISIACAALPPPPSPPPPSPPPPIPPGGVVVVTATITANLSLTGEAFIAAFGAADRGAVLAAVAAAAGLPAASARLVSLSYVVSVQLSLLLPGIGVSAATRAAVAQTVATAAGGAAVTVVPATSSSATSPAGRRRLLQSAMSVTASALYSDNATSAAAASRLADSVALGAAVATAVGVPATVTRAARRELAFVVALQLPTANASGAASAAAAASAKLSTAAAAGTLLASNAALQSRANATLAAAPSVSLAQAVLAPPLPPPSPLPPLPSPLPPLPPAAMPTPKAALLTTRHMAAVLILSVVGLVAALGLAFRACASPKRPSAPMKGKTQMLPAPAQEEGHRGALLLHVAEGDAEVPPAGADEVEAEVGPPVASREPWEHTPVPAPKPAERPRGVPRVPPPALPASAAEGEHGALRRLALLQQLSEAAGASVDEAAPRAAGQASPGEVTSPAPAAADVAAASPPGGGADAQWFENPLSRGESESGGEQEHAEEGEAGPALHGGSDDDEAPLPQQLHASEWALLGTSQSPASLAQQPRWSALLPPAGQSASSDEEEDGAATRGERVSSTP